MVSRHKSQIYKDFERKIVNIFYLSINLNNCFGCSKEPSHRDSSFEYQQRIIRCRISKLIFNYSLLPGSA